MEMSNLVLLRGYSDPRRDEIGDWGLGLGIEGVIGKGLEAEAEVKVCIEL